MEVFIDPGLKQVPYLIYDSHNHQIVEWGLDTCHEQVNIKTISQEETIRLISTWMKDHEKQLDEASWIYVEGQSPRIYHNSSAADPISKMTPWMYMLAGKYPHKLMILWPKALKKFLGSKGKTWNANKQDAINFTRSTLLEGSFWKKQFDCIENWSSQHNMADVFVMMMYAQKIK